MTKLIVKGESVEDIASALSIIQGLIETGNEWGKDGKLSWEIKED